VLDIVPNDPDTVASEAKIYQAEGNLEQAGKLLAGVNAQTPSLETFIVKMNQLFLERQFDEAIRLIHSRLTESRDLPEFERLFEPLFLALAQGYSGDIAGARATAQQMLRPLETFGKKAPDNPFFALGFSLTHAVLGEKDAAIKEVSVRSRCCPVQRMQWMGLGTRRIWRPSRPGSATKTARFQGCNVFWRFRIITALRRRF
jgi:hypothetical protein